MSWDDVVLNVWSVNWKTIFRSKSVYFSWLHMRKIDSFPENLSSNSVDVFNVIAYEWSFSMNEMFVWVLEFYVFQFCLFSFHKAKSMSISLNFDRYRKRKPICKLTTDNWHEPFLFIPKFQRKKKSTIFYLAATMTYFSSYHNC